MNRDNKEGEEGREIKQVQKQMSGCFSDPISVKEAQQQIAAQSNLPLIPGLVTNCTVLYEIWANMLCSYAKREFS